MLAAGAIASSGGQLRIAHDRFAEAFERQTWQGCRADEAARIADILRAAGVAGDDGDRGALMLQRRIDAGLEDCPFDPWRDEFVRGAARMRTLGDARRASLFAQAAITLSATPHTPSFVTCREAVFAALDAADHAAARAHAELARTAAANEVECQEADELCAMAYRMSGDVDGAVSAAIRGLARIGIKIPRRPGLIEVLRGLFAALSRSPSRYAELPPLTGDKLAVQAPMMRAINAMGSLLYERNSALAMVLAARALPDEVIGGTAAGAASQAILCAEFGAFGRAVKWAELSDARQGADQPLRAVARQYATDFGYRYSTPRAQVGRGRPIEQLALSEGDLAAAIYSAHHALFDSLMGDGGLEQAAHEARRAIEIIERLKDKTNAPRIHAMARLVERLRSGGDLPWLIDADALAEATTGRLSNVERGLALYAAMLGVAYGAYEQVCALHAKHASAFAPSPFHSQTQHWTFLTALARLRLDLRPGAVELALLFRACKYNSHDNAHRATVIKAERARLRRHRARALALYATAIDQARRSRCLLELGMVCEAAAQGAMQLAAPESAARFTTAAADAWRRLGANGVAVARGHEAAVSSSAVTSHPVPVSNALDRLIAEKQAAERTSRAKSRFLATAGHELRTPLQGIIGLLDLPDDAHPDLAAVRARVAHLTRIVDDLMDMAAVEAGALVIRQAPFDILVALEQAIEDAGTTSEHLISALDLNMPAGGMVIGDETRLRQIVSNLVVNSLRHGQAGIVIRAALLNSGSDQVVLSFEVTDEGPGIAMEELARLFEPFEKGDPNSAGLGLGLPLARRLAHAMGGALTCDNRPGGGFASVLKVPFQTARGAGASESKVPGLNVLLVEDTVGIAHTMADWLRKAGHTVTVMHEPSSAKDAAGHQRFDAAIVDAQLARGLDGLELAASLQTLPHPPTLTVIMSAAVDNVVAARGEALRAQVIQKPVTRKTLLEALTGTPTFPTTDACPSDEAFASMARPRHEAIEEIHRHIEQSMATLERALLSGDDAAFQSEAHRLAGLAGHFGFHEIARSALALQSDPGARSANSLGSLRSAISNAFPGGRSAD
jgi:signal transduction histidine kinase/ActR/RegA family two-component response regulator